MLYSQKRLDALIDNMGMRYEVGRLFEAGATYEMFAETLFEMIGSRVKSTSAAQPRPKLSRDQDIVCKYNGVCTDKEYTQRELGQEFGISGPRVRDVLHRNWQPFLDAENRASEMKQLFETMDISDTPARIYIRGRMDKSGRVRNEIYDRVLEKVMRA